MSGAALALSRAAGPGGLWLEVTAAGLPSQTHAVPGLDVRDLHLDPRWLRGALAAHWRGLFRVDEPGDHRLVVESDGPVRVLVDDVAVVQAGAGRTRASVALTAGLHSLSIEYRNAAPPRRLRAHWAPPGGSRRPFGGDAVFRAAPTGAEAARGRAARVLGWAALGAWVAPPLWVAAVALGRRWRTGQWPHEWRPAWLAAAWPRMRPALRVALPALVVVYAGALRFEALVGRYGWQGPPWAVRASRAVEVLHGGGLRWDPAAEEYAGDPLTYLRRARAMRGLFDADVREPLFPFATRLLLGPLHDRPLAVNAASAVFSTLCVLATYLLGAAAFGPAVGLGAALLLAADRDVLWWGVEGFRDDAFTFLVVLSAWLMVRLRQGPTALAGVLAGLAAGAACLTRITAFSFILPACAWLALERGPTARARRRAARAGSESRRVALGGSRPFGTAPPNPRRAVAVLLAGVLLVAGPYMLACTVAYGDPFYAVNFHTKFYRSRTGLAYDAPMTWHGYLRQGFAPGALLETGLRGLTTYPFSNKWAGLDHVSPWLRRLLAPAAVAGLLLFLRAPPGRLLLVILVGVLLPYAFTWRIPGGAEWRFTLPAYPFYLVAACSAVQAAVLLLRRRQAGDLRA